MGDRSSGEGLEINLYTYKNLFIIKMKKGLVIFGILFLIGLFFVGVASAGTKIIDYGFEDWTGDADTTPGYIFSTDYLTYWDRHKSGTEVISSCEGRTAYEGNYFWRKNFFEGANDPCLGTIVTYENT